VGVVTPTVQFGIGEQSGLFSEAGLAIGGNLTAGKCIIDKIPINP
jgi:hypothetical protein